MNKLIIGVFLAIAAIFLMSCKKDDAVDLASPDASKLAKHGVTIESPTAAWAEELSTTDETTGEIVYSTELSSPMPVRFIFDYQEEGGSAKSLSSEYSIPADLISITPAVKGSWSWESDFSIAFYPEKDWSADTEYNVSFDKSLFNPDYALKSYTHTIKTQPFTAQIASFQLYKSPVNASGELSPPYASLKVAFSYPVDQASFKQGFFITHEGVALEYSVTFDTANRYAYVKTAAVPIGAKATLLKAELKSATSGGAKLAEPVVSSADVPSFTDFFKVNSVSSTIIRDKDETPEQFIILDFSLPVAASRLKNNLTIYKLPRDFNGDRYYDWQERNEPITQDIVDNLSTLSFELSDDSENMHGAKIVVRPDDNIQLGVLIRKGVTSQNGYPLAENYFRILNVPKLPNELKFMQDGGMLSLTGDRMLTFMARNVSKVKIEVSRIIPDRLNHLISQTGGDMDGVQFVNYNFSESDISTTTSREISLNNSDPAKINYFTFDMSPYLAGSNGVFVVKTYYMMPNSSYYQFAEKRLIRVTDIGIVMKANTDDTRDIFVLSVRSGQVLSDAKVSYLARNGRLAHTAYTDSQGHVKLPQPYTNRLEEDYPIALTVANGDDFSFLPFNKEGTLIQYNRFDVGGDYSYSNAYATYTPLKSFTFTDRGLYRPGDKVHIGIITKQGGDLNLAGVPMEIVISDPNGQEVLKHRFTLNDSGVYELSHQTEYFSLTGFYSIAVNVISERGERWEYNQLGAMGFRVEEFQPDTMKINAYINGAAAKGWLPMDNLTLAVSLTNLYGSPAQNRTVRWHYQLTPTDYHFDEYKDYIFTDPYIDKRSTRQFPSINLPDGTTDDKGLASVALDLSNYAGGLYSVVANAEGFEAGSGDSVATVTSERVSPMQHLVGYKYADLHYIKRNSAVQAEFIAINSNLDKIKLSDLKYSVVEKKFIPILVRQRDGAYGFQSVPKDEVVGAGRFAISEAGSAFTLPTDTAGSFELSITDDSGLLLARLVYFVAGDTNLTLSLEKDALLDLKLDKGEYSAGDEIEVNIITPYAGAGLITIEREKVYSAKWFTTETTSTRQTIRVPEGLEGNGYVNVSFVRAADSKEVLVNPYSYGVAPFNVDRSKHNIEIKLDVPAVARPNEPLSIKYTTNKTGKIIVYAVDEGILQVAGYQTPDPLAEFLRKRALQVTTFQTLNLLLSDAKVIREAAGVGGGYAADRAFAEAMMKANINPFRRKVDAPVVFWSGIIDVKVGEEGEVKFTPPSYFNGALRVMAVAANASASGSASAQVLVKAPIIVQPNLPVSLIPSDIAQMSVSVANNIEGSGEATIEVALESDEFFTIIGDSKKTITLKEGSEGRLDFTVQANAKLGSGTVTAIATSDKYIGNPIKINSTASIHPAVAYETRITVGINDSGKVTLKNFSREMYAEFAKRSVTASHNPLLIARGLTEYLNEYPYNCTEQLVSRLFPALYISGQRDFTERYNELLNTLRARQLSNGSFTLWQNGRSIGHDYTTIYALHFLTDAKAKGHFVPSDMMDRGLSYLQKLIASDVTDVDDATLKAYAAYILTRNGIITTSFITSLEENLTRADNTKWKSGIVSAYIASIYKMLQMDEKGAELIRGYVPEVKRFIFHSDFDSSSLRNSVYLYLLARHFPDMVSKIDQKIVTNLMESIAGGHYSSLLASYSMIALASIAENTTDEGIAIAIDNAPQEIMLAPYPTVEYNSAIASATATGGNGLYIVASESGFDLKTPEKTANGIEIERKYLDKDGNELMKFTQGDDVYIRLRVRANGDMPHIENVAIVDLLPGAFEVQIDSIDSLRAEVYADDYAGRLFDYVDVREDRVIFYAPIRSEVSEFTYRAKVVSRGEFSSPPSFAQAMYDPVYRGNTASGKIVVGESNE